MSKSVFVAAGAALLLAGVSVGWISSRSGIDERLRDAESAAESAKQQATALAAEVARLRDAVGAAESTPVSGASATRAPQRTLTSAVEDHSTRLAALETALPAAGAARSVDKGRLVLADLQANRDGARVAAIRESVQELVRIGDPIVPEIAGVLDSGLDTRYRDDRPLMQHLRGYVGIRMVLDQALREIGTPTARNALFEAAKKSRRPADFRDILYDSESTTDPALIDGIAALVPDMIRSLAESPVAGYDGEWIDLAWSLSTWLRKHPSPAAIEPLEDALRKAPTDSENGWMGYDALFGSLAELAIERAARVVVEIQQRDPKSNLPRFFMSRTEGQMSLAQSAVFYGVLVSRTDLRPDERLALYRGMPSRADGNTKDPAKRMEDARTFVAFLEERLRVETDEATRREIKTKMEALRKAIEESPK